jgi:hypothetical protein
MPTANAAEKAKTQVLAYRSEAHFKPGTTIDDPLANGKITLANPAVIANATKGGRFQIRAPFVCEDGKTWEYLLRDVSMRLRSKVKGKGKADDVDPSPLAAR